MQPDAGQITPGPSTGHEINNLPVAHTTCCIVGGGPAGAVLALLLAKEGISVILLEAHLDFDREFRGDTLHASVMEILDQLGLAERLLQLQHSKVTSLNLPTAGGALTVNLFGSLKSKFPYITVMPQAQFLTFITDEAKQYPNFQLVMGAHVDALIEEDGMVRGVRYRTRSEHHELRAELTVAADGRFSTMRKLAQLELIKTSSPIDVLWFRVSRRESDPAEALGARVGNNLFLVMIDRFNYWQVGCVIVKGGYAQLRERGLQHFHQALSSIAPDFADRFEEVQDWKQMSVLSVEASRLKRWYRPGLLLIGDAAHVMSPVGGVGINYAIQDAVVASNVLVPKLKAGTPISERELAMVQRQRELPTRIIQTFQSLAQRGVAAQVVSSQGRRVFAVPGFVIPVLKTRWLLALPARFIAYGFCPPRLQIAGTS
jgi:2-polyprenyl-6-methoxyphenol hydroxylase-like FAD-dependent oxidoreductase